MDEYVHDLDICCLPDNSVHVFCSDSVSNDSDDLYSCYGVCPTVLDSPRPRSGVVEMPIVLSHETEGGTRLCLTHPLSLTGFRAGLAKCLEKELIHFVLDGIEHGVHLGPLEGQVDANPYCCRNGKGIVG